MAEAVETRHGHAAPAARWAVVALLGVIAGCLVMELGFGTSAAKAQASLEGPPGALTVVSGSIGPDGFGLYVVDTKSRTMCVYRVLGGKLQLLAARNLSYDLQLDDYNNAPKTPREIREIAEKQKRLDEVRPPR